MNKEEKPIRSVIHWVNPPEIGQPLDELEWAYIDIYEDGHVVLRDDPPSQAEVERIVRELSNNEKQD